MVLYNQPCFPDNNSVHSLRDLMLRVLPGWYSQWKRRLDDQATTEERGGRDKYSQLLMTNKMPYILPVVVNNYRRVGANKKNKLGELDELSTLFTERLELVMKGQELDADNKPRKIPDQIQKMLFPFGSAAAPQYVVRLIPHASELSRWSQLTGRSMTVCNMQ